MCICVLHTCAHMPNENIKANCLNFTEDSSIKIVLVFYFNNVEIV